MRSAPKAKSVKTKTPPVPRGARDLGGAAGAQARSAEHPPGVGIHPLPWIWLACVMAACSGNDAPPGGGGTPVGCVPGENAGVVGDECGVFVAAGGDDAAAGTKSAPMQTIAAAIAKASMNGGRVYACAETFAGAVEVPAGMTIFGGLDCVNGWMWVGEAQKTIVEGAADEVALRVSGGEGAVRIEDVAVRAADAVVAGASSIAVMIDGATAELVRCELTAGNGAEGAQGAPGAAPDGMGQIPAAAAGMQGNPGVNACSDLDMSGMPDATLLGGGQVLNDCGAGQQSIGGRGGVGDIADGGDGARSTPNPETAGGGLGEPSAGAWSCGGAEPNGSGDDATDGTPGMPGIGGVGGGTLSSTTGYAGVRGGAGTSGQPGQGGGGGGGAKGGNTICPGGLAGAGASGGSGGAGGCGGQPGQGGGPGGASIALASVNAQVTLTGCRLTAGSGGRGGAGGDAQAGGQGGAGGPGGQTAGIAGIKAACDGGKGGQGGDGGPGGGGLGGPSAGIAYVGAAVVKDAATTLTMGTAGAGGPGGNADLAINSGAAGAAVEELELP